MFCPSVDKLKVVSLTRIFGDRVDLRLIAIHLLFFCQLSPEADASRYLTDGTEHRSCKKVGGQEIVLEHALFHILTRILRGSAL